MKIFVWLILQRDRGMKTMTNAEFIAELERERQSSVKIVAIGVVVVLVAMIIAIAAIAEAKSEEKKLTEYQDNVMIAML